MIILWTGPVLLGACSIKRHAEGQRTVSTYDLLIEKGIEKGRNEERVKAQRLIEQERAKAEQERAKAYAGKLESALKMKKSGFDNAMIADVLTLPIEEVEKL